MKLYEFTDKLYAMGGIEQEKKKSRRLNESLGGIDWAEGQALEDSYLHLNWYEFYDDEYHRTYYAATDGEAFKAMIWPVGSEYDITAELGSKTLYDNRIHLGDDDEAINFIENLFMEKVVLPNADIDESFDDWAEELDYYAEKVSDDLYKYEGNKEFDKYVDEVLSDAGVLNIGDLEINDLKKISNYADNLNESSATVEESYHSDDFRDLCREYSSLYPYDISLREVWNEIVSNYEDEDLANDVVDYLEDAFGDEEEYEDEFFESLNEARNPENDEVNAVLRKWANSDRNRISKRDQKILDDASISLKTDRYDAPHKYAVHKNNESDIDLHRMDKRHIKSTHPDHDLANDLATTGRHWSNRDRYNKNKDPRFPWRDAEYRSETPEESDALRPYSDKYKSLKSAVDNSEGYPYLHGAAKQDLDDFRAEMVDKKNKRKNESLNEAKTRTKANIHLVQNMFDEAVKNGLYDKAKKIVENRGIKVDKDKLYETPTSACTGAYIDLKKLLYK